MISFVGDVGRVRYGAPFNFRRTACQWIRPIVRSAPNGRRRLALIKLAFVSGIRGPDSVATTPSAPLRYKIRMAI